MRIGSLFSGVGGLELGLEWSGVGATRWQVEIDPFCRERLARQWPHVERFDDVSATGAYYVWRHVLPAVDLLCGGAPCQDVSAAGRKAGLAGARSGLWREFRRVAEELRSPWVVVENVTSGARLWVDAVRSDLGQLGYASLPINLEARWFGAPAVRSRIFVVAHAHGFPLRKLEQWGPERWAREIRACGEPQPGRSSWWSAYPRMGHVGDGLSTKLDVDHRRALGNAVMPVMSQLIGTCILQLAH